MRFVATPSGCAAPNSRKKAPSPHGVKERSCGRRLGRLIDSGLDVDSTAGAAIMIAVAVSDCGSGWHGNGLASLLGRARLRLDCGGSGDRGRN